MRVLFVTIFLAVSPIWGADPLQAVYDRMDHASQTIKGFTADLVKIDHSDPVDVNDKSVGTIAVRRSVSRNGQPSVQVLEKINTMNDKPDGEQWELGQFFIVYRPKEQAKQEYDVKKYRGFQEAAFGLLAGSSADLKKSYQVAYGGPETVNSQPCTRLVLRPIETQFSQMFPKVEIWVSDTSGVVMQQKFYEKGEKDYQVQTYSNMKFGTPTDAQIKMEVPNGVKTQRIH
jgi:hypothetical protein